MAKVPGTKEFIELRRFLALPFYRFHLVELIEITHMVEFPFGDSHNQKVLYRFLNDLSDCTVEDLYREQKFMGLKSSLSLLSQILMNQSQSFLSGICL